MAAPIVNIALATQFTGDQLIAYYGEAAPTFYFQLDFNTFSDDVTSTSALNESAIVTLSDGSPLPAFLTYSLGARKFTGRPGVDDAGTYTVRITVTDGEGLSVYDEFPLLVRDYNQIPVNNYDLDAKYAYFDKLFTYQIPEDLFTDPEGVELIYSATLNDVNESDLPIWLSFNPTTRSFSGTPDISDEGVSTIKIKASDGEGEATAVLTLNVQEHAPPVVNTATTLTGYINKKLGSIIDIEAITSPTYEPLGYEIVGRPSWLTFISPRRKFLGTPVNTDELKNISSSTISVKENGAGFSIAFLLNEIATNVTEGVEFNAGATVTDTATNIATYLNGLAGVEASALNDVITITPEATYRLDDLSVSSSDLHIEEIVSVLTLKVSDPYSEIETPIVLTLHNPYLTVSVDNPIANQYLRQDQSLNFQVPANTFSVTSGSLRYRAKIMTPDGYEKNLPSWISFNGATRTFSGNPEDLEGLKMKTFQIAVIATSDDGHEDAALFYLTLGAIDNTGTALGKTEADCKYVITAINGVDLQIDFSDPAYNIQPGDTIGIDCSGGTVIGGRLKISNINGLPGKPVYLTNINGTARYSSANAYLWKFEGCNNLVVAGQGTYADPCGIKLIGLSGSSSAIQYNKDNHYHVEFAWIHVPQSSFSGISIKNQLYEFDGQRGDSALGAQYDDMEGVRVQHCLVENTGGEGIYLGYGQYRGKSFPSGTKYPHDIKDVRIHDNVCFRVGWDAYQFKNTVSNCKYYNNYCYYSSLKTAGGQNEGVNIGDGFTGEFFNNWIQVGRNTAIRLDASGNCDIHHNVFIGFQGPAIYCARRGRTDDPLLSNIPNSSQYARVWNNTIIDIDAPNELVNVTLDVDYFECKNNLFVSNGSKTIKINTDGEESNNVILGNIAAAKFRDYANFDLRPSSNSPAVGAGTDLSSYGVLVEDYYGNEIDWVNVDAGAFISTGSINLDRADAIQALYQPSEAPMAPSLLTGTAISSSRINLSWQDNSTNELKFIIEFKVEGATNFTRYGEVGENVTTASVLGLTASTNYVFRVKASNNLGDSYFSNEATATTQAAAVTVPAAPSGLAVTAITDKTVSLSWNLNSTTEQSVNIQSQTNSNWNTVLTLEAGATSGTVIGLNPDTDYILRVVASNSVGDSLPSGQVNVKTLPLFESSTEGVTWAYIENKQITSGFSSSYAAIPSEVLAKPNLHIVSDTIQKSFPAPANFEGVWFSAGTESEMRYKFVSGILWMAWCVADNVWVVKAFSAVSSSSGSSSWSSLSGSPSDSEALLLLIGQQASQYGTGNKRILIPFATHTGNTDKTTLFTINIPAGTLKAGCIIVFKPQFDNSLSSGVASALTIEIGGVNVINFSSATGKSYFREQQVYITADNGNNNTYFRIITGTGDQEGSLNSNLSKGTIDWTVDQIVIISTTLGGAVDTVNLIGGSIDFIIESDSLE